MASGIDNQELQAYLDTFDEESDCLSFQEKELETDDKSSIQLLHEQPGDDDVDESENGGNTTANEISDSTVLEEPEESKITTRSKTKAVYAKNKKANNTAKRKKKNANDESKDDMKFFEDTDLVAEGGSELYDFNEQDEDQKSDVNVHRVVARVNNHQTTAPSAVTLQCPDCNYATSKRFLLARHMKTHSDDRPYKCSICERGFKVNSVLLNHLNTHLDKKPHPCKSCDMRFNTLGELFRHVRYKHTKERPHKCTECDYASVELSKLKRHMRCHTGERPYQCPHCTYASADTFKLKRHLRTHTGEKPYECEICHTRFSQANTLKLHRLIHSVGDKQIFQCPLCPTTCGRQNDLRLHIQNIHNTDNPVPCKRCGKELPDRYAYKMHLKTHVGEKCFRCTICPYASTLQRQLDAHLLIHLGEKPFPCEHCGAKFRQRHLLLRHVNIYHNKDYVPPTPRAKVNKCPHCHKSFTLKGYLMRHMEMHDPDSDLKRQKLQLRIGRMTRVKPDGTITTVLSSKQLQQLEGEQKEINKKSAYKNIEIVSSENFYDDVAVENENYDSMEARDDSVIDIPASNENDKEFLDQAEIRLSDIQNFELEDQEGGENEGLEEEQIVDDLEFYDDQPSLDTKNNIKIINLPNTARNMELFEKEVIRQHNQKTRGNLNKSKQNATTVSAKKQPRKQQLVPITETLNDSSKGINQRSFNNSTDSLAHCGTSTLSKEINSSERPNVSQKSAVTQVHRIKIKKEDIFKTQKAEEKIITVNFGDDDEYMVIEVIEECENTDGNGNRNGKEEIEDQNIVEDERIFNVLKTNNDNVDDLMENIMSPSTINNMPMNKTDLANCFGFEEEDDAHQGSMKIANSNQNNNIDFLQSKQQFELFQLIEDD